MLHSNGRSVLGTWDTARRTSRTWERGGDQGTRTKKEAKPSGVAGKLSLKKLKTMQARQGGGQKRLPTREGGGGALHGRKNWPYGDWRIRITDGDGLGRGGKK